MKRTLNPNLQPHCNYKKPWNYNFLRLIINTNSTGNCILMHALHVSKIETICIMGRNIIIFFFLCSQGVSCQSQRRISTKMGSSINGMKLFYKFSYQSLHAGDCSTCIHVHGIQNRYILHVHEYGCGCGFPHPFSKPETWFNGVSLFIHVHVLIFPMLYDNSSCSLMTFPESLVIMIKRGFLVCLYSNKLCFLPLSYSGYPTT